MEITYQTEEGAPEITYRNPIPDKNLIQQIPSLDLNNIARFHMTRPPVKRQPDALNFNNAKDILTNHPVNFKFRPTQWLNVQEMVAFMSDEQRNIFLELRQDNQSSKEPNTPRAMTQFNNPPMPPVLSPEELEEIKQIQELKLETLEREVNIVYDDLNDKGKEFVAFVATLPWVEPVEVLRTNNPERAQAEPVKNFPSAPNNTEAIAALINADTEEGKAEQEKKDSQYSEEFLTLCGKLGIAPPTSPTKEMGNINLAVNENKNLPPLSLNSYTPNSPTTATTSRPVPPTAGASGNDIINTIIKESKSQSFIEEYQKQFREERDKLTNNMNKRKAPSTEEQKNSDNAMDMLFGASNPKPSNPSPRLQQQAIIRSMTKKYNHQDMIEIPYDLFSNNMYVMSCVAAAREIHSTK